MLEIIRRGFAWLLLASMPAAVLYWYLVHPLIDFWRRLGKGPTYLALVALFALNLWGAWVWREPLLASDLGANPWLMAIGGALYVATIFLSLAVRRQLSFRILAGVPELDADGKGGELLQEGVYARIRHPRYAAVMLGSLAVTLFVNFGSVWLMTAFLAPALYGVVLMEERELRLRFGDRYDEYARRVPRFWPRPRR